MMLDALDSGADILVFTQDEELATFGAIRAEAERVMGRDIEIALLSFVELQEMMSGVVA
jgi:hypothetical protein